MKYNSTVEINIAEMGTESILKVKTGGHSIHAFSPQVQKSYTVKSLILSPFPVTESHLSKSYYTTDFLRVFFYSCGKDLFGFPTDVNGFKPLPRKRFCFLQGPFKIPEFQVVEKIKGVGGFP